MKKDLVSINDLSLADIKVIFKKAEEFKKRKIKNTEKILKGKNFSLIFEKPSTRTRVSFEVGIIKLGGNPIYLNSSDLQLSRGETIKDTARVLSRYVDGIIVRAKKHSDVVELAKEAAVSVINALTDIEHPCQALADLFTVFEHKSGGIKIAYVGDGNNVANSLLLCAAKLGVDISIASPKEYEIEKNIFNIAREESVKTRCKISLVNDPEVAAKDADVIYTDVWVSMGDEAERDTRLKVLKPFQINRDLMKLAKKDCIIMHCLPAHIDEEITEDIFESRNSVVFDQAENRLYIQQAILSSIY